MLDYLQLLKQWIINNNYSDLPIIVENEIDGNNISLYEVTFQDNQLDIESEIEFIYKEKRNDEIDSNFNVVDIKNRIKLFYQKINVMHTIKINNLDVENMVCSELSLRENEKKYILGHFLLSFKIRSIFLN